MRGDNLPKAWLLSLSSLSSSKNRLKRVISSSTSPLNRDKEGNDYDLQVPAAKNDVQIKLLFDNPYTARCKIPSLQAIPK
jgi:hypothetical protein